MATKELIKSGAVIEFRGRYWGIQYQDGQCTEWSWGPIENARVCDVDEKTKPVDFGGRFHEREELKKGVFRCVRIEKKYVVDYQTAPKTCIDNSKI